jgi:histidinol-phosphate aminotransferase
MSQAGHLAELINLALNESPFGASPGAIAAARASVGQAGRYADVRYTSLREGIGARYGIDPALIVCGNGSEELVECTARAFAGAGAEIIFPIHSFILFSVVTARLGANAILSAESNFICDVDDILRRTTDRTRLVFLANPNNPTGSVLPASEIARLRVGLPAEIVLVIDAAYAEYVRDPTYSAGHDLVAAGTRTVVLQTFSKAFGLPGLRIGWAHAPAELAKALDRTRNLSNVNSVGVAAALGALADPAFVARVVDATIVNRAQLESALAKLGLEPLPSVGNFIAVRFPEACALTATEAHEFLRSSRILVRPLADYGLPDYLRITIGSREQIKILVDRLAKGLSRS